jgi:hypothetical protein
MTVDRNLVRCDADPECGDYLARTITNTPGSATRPLEELVRAHVHEQGWTTTEDGRDLCPKHST